MQDKKLNECLLVKVEKFLNFIKFDSQRADF